jgi:hypothetical protein
MIPMLGARPRDGCHVLVQSGSVLSDRIMLERGSLWD